MVDCYGKAIQKSKILQLSNNKKRHMMNPSGQVIQGSKINEGDF